MTNPRKLSRAHSTGEECRLNFGCHNAQLEFNTMDTRTAEVRIRLPNELRGSLNAVDFVLLGSVRCGNRPGLVVYEAREATAD